MIDHRTTESSTYQATVTTPDPTTYELTLFVAGASELAMRAIANVRTLCELHLGGHYRLEVVDIHRSLALTVANNVLAAPTLIRTAPLPVRRLVGDMSDTSRVLGGLGIRSVREPQR